ncbi:MAG: hypothetical protein KIS76_15170 [Pyrinomonadaceae bacterium]|nr:hypothetical protein [Pyrinomonadaceae bacterium]
MKLLKFILQSVVLLSAFSLAGCWSPTAMDSSSGSATPRDSSPTPERSSNDKPNNDNKMIDSKNTVDAADGFAANLPAGFTMPTDAVGKKMLKEYGAIFVAKDGVTPPPKVVFNNESEVSAWQSGVSKSTETIDGATIELQSNAMKALKDAIAEANQSGVKIAARGGSDAARRDYSGTVKNWNSRVEPGLKHWVRKGKITQSEANRIKGLSIPEQITEIFKLEEQRIYFSIDFSKSIIYSVAPPGTSQHISMLAFDVQDHANPKVREILEKHGWFQTVFSDLPHFTYLGVTKDKLSGLGLKKVSDGGREFWMPDI